MNITTQNRPTSLDVSLKWSHDATIKVPARQFFPMDMLRYDRCSPKTQEDVTKLLQSFDRNHSNLDITVVAFSSTKTRLPFTRKRWQSFGVDIIC